MVDINIHPDYLRDRGRDFGTMAAAAQTPPGLAAGAAFARSAHPLIYPDSTALAETLTQAGQGAQQWVTGLGATLGFYRDFVTRAADVFQANDGQGADKIARIERDRRITGALAGLTAQIPRDPRVPPVTTLGTD